MSKLVPVILFFGLLGLASYPLLLSPTEVEAGEVSREFRVERDDAPTPLELVTAELRKILQDLATGRINASDGDAIRTQLLIILQEEGIGRGALRGPAVTQSLEDILHQARSFEERTPLLTEMQRDAIDAIASQTANELIARVSGEDHEVVLLGPTPEGYDPVSWSQLSDFEWSEGIELPAAIQALDDQKVALRGVLMALDTDTEFLLVQSLWSCCYGEPPEMNEAVVVTVPEGVEVHSGVPIRVLGTLSAGEKREEGEVIGLYEMQADQIERGQ